MIVWVGKTPWIQDNFDWPSNMGAHKELLERKKMELELFIALNLGRLMGFDEGPWKLWND